MKKFAIILFAMVLAAGRAQAADYYWSGAGTWDTNSSNWGTSSGGSYNATNWPNSGSGVAIFEGTPGTVTINTNIICGGMRFDVAGYTITNAATNLYFACVNGSTIQCDTASAVITPDIQLNAATLTLGGTGSGTIAGHIRQMAGTCNLVKTGSGTWTWLGGAPYAGGYAAGNVTINEGILKAYANIGLSYERALNLNSGGEFHYNAPNALYSPDGNGRAWNLNGGSFDNSSGGAIVSGPAWMGGSVNADTTFIGSQGTNSDLTLNVIMTWAVGKKITVSNALATLTIYGNSYAGGLGREGANGIIKAGAGTLRLTGNLTYTGDTTVEKGTLALGSSGSVTNGLRDSTALRIAKGALVSIDEGFNDTINKLYLNGREAMAGTWGSRKSNATYRWDEYFKGSGVLTVTSGEGVVPIHEGTVVLIR
jgi:fibronectin-binding autotransporter adhesin